MLAAPGASAGRPLNVYVPCEWVVWPGRAALSDIAREDGRARNMPSASRPESGTVSVRAEASSASEAEVSTSTARSCQ